MAHHIAQHYGLHEDHDELWWLMQYRDNYSAVGLKNNDCPFEIRHPALSCPHLFNMQDAEEDLRILKSFDELCKESELARLMSPVPYLPEKNLVYIRATDPMSYMRLNQLLQLACPVSTGSMHRRSFKSSSDAFEKLERKLMNSNLSRQLIYDLPAYDEKFIQLTSRNFMSINSRLFFAGAKQVLYGINEGFILEVGIEETIKDFLFDFKNPIQLRKLGAGLIKRFMRP